MLPLPAAATATAAATPGGAAAGLPLLDELLAGGVLALLLASARLLPRLAVRAAGELIGRRESYQRGW